MAGCAECRDEIERLRPAADALPRSVEQVEPPPAPEGGADGDRGARGERGPDAPAAAPARARAPRPSLGERLRRGLRPPCVRSCVAGALALGVVAGFGVAQLGGTEDARTVTAAVDKARLPSASGSLQIPGDGEDGAILRVHGMPALETDQPTRCGCSATARSSRRRLFSVGADGDGAAAVPDDARGRRRGAWSRASRAAARARPSEEPDPRWSACRPQAMLRAVEVCYRHPKRETGCRCSNCGRPICPDCMTADLGRHALPRVRGPEARRCGRCARQRRAAAHLRPDGDQRGGRARRAGSAARAPPAAALATHAARRGRCRGLRGRPTASTGACSPRASCTRASSTSLFNMFSLYILGAHARARDRPLALRADLLRLAAARARSARCCSSRMRSRSAPPARSSA